MLWCPGSSPLWYDVEDAGSRWGQPDSCWFARTQDAPPLFATLNPLQPPAPEKVLRHLKLAHPVFSFASRDAQERLPTLQVQRCLLQLVLVQLTMPAKAAPMPEQSCE
jgi:hypothetical protein